MNHLLFLNKQHGIDFILARKLDKENIEYFPLTIKDDWEIYKKYGVKSTPVLLILDKDEEADRMMGVEEIAEYLKNDVSNNQT